MPRDALVTTSKVDKYGRYLPGVFLHLRSGGETFRNNALPENCHVVHFDASTQDDWAS